MVFLTADRIAFGVNKLLEFTIDRESIESRRPPIPPGGGHACHYVDSEEFGDGMAFQLRIWSRCPTPSEDVGSDPAIRQLFATISSPPMDQASKSNDLEIEIIWLFVEPPPEELLLPSRDGPNPELVAFLQAARSWVLRVRVCEGCFPCIAPKGNADLRKVRSVLDGFTMPRVILPTKEAAGFRDDLIALIALFATKEQCLSPKDEKLARFFRSYCDRFFGVGQKRKKLSESEWHGIVFRVFERLYSGKVGMGFTMPAFPGSFRKYVAAAINGGVASATSKGPRIPKQGRFPPSIADAATLLHVSHMTVRRHMQRLKLREWTEEAWRVVSAEITPKKQWQELTAELVKSGLNKEAARKWVQRCKKSGLTLKEARRLKSSAKQRGTCAACKVQQALGELYQGKFLCGECYAEKLGIPGLE